MARYLLSLLLLLGISPIIAQEFQGTIRGQIIDEEDNPIPGATAVIENTSIGALTDVNGNFQISTSLASGTLIISYLGYQNQQIPFVVKNAQILDLGEIKLEYEAIILPCCCCYVAPPPISSESVWPVNYRRNNPKLRDSHNSYSEPAILNGQIPGIIVPQAVNPQTYFQNAYYGEASQVMLNGLVLAPSSQMGNALLWQLERQDIGLLNPQQSLAHAGIRGINGSLNYQSDSYIESGLKYRNALGLSQQEHHLDFGTDYKKGSIGISAHHTSGRFANFPNLQTNGASVDHYIAHKSSGLYTELQAAKVSWEDSFGERQQEQLVSLYNRFHQSMGKTSLRVFQSSLWFNQASSQKVDSSAQHDIKLEAARNFNNLRLRVEAGSEYFHSDYLRSTS